MTGRLDVGQSSLRPGDGMFEVPGDRLRELGEKARGFDALVAAIDFMVIRGVLNARSLAADVRMDWTDTEPLLSEQAAVERLRKIGYLND